MYLTSVVVDTIISSGSTPENNVRHDTRGGHRTAGERQHVKNGCGHQPSSIVQSSRTDVFEKALVVSLYVIKNKVG